MYESLLDGVKSTLQERIKEGIIPLKTVTGMEVCVSSGRGAKGSGAGQGMVIGREGMYMYMYVYMYVYVCVCVCTYQHI